MSFRPRSFFALTLVLSALPIQSVQAEGTKPEAPCVRKLRETDRRIDVLRANAAFREEEIGQVQDILLDMRRKAFPLNASRAVLTLGAVVRGGGSGLAMLGGSLFVGEVQGVTEKRLQDQIERASQDRDDSFERSKELVHVRAVARRGCADAPAPRVSKVRPVTGGAPSVSLREVKAGVEPEVAMPVSRASGSVSQARN